MTNCHIHTKNEGFELFLLPELSPDSDSGQIIKKELKVDTNLIV